MVGFSFISFIPIENDPGRPGTNTMTKTKLFLITFALLLTIIPPAFAQKSGLSELTPGPGMQNETQAIATLKEIYKAEAAYYWGAGSFGYLGDLREAQLIDRGLGKGERYGYKFTLTRSPAWTQEPERFRIWANPVQYGRTGTRSFYMTNACLILGADTGGGDADQNSPLVDQCTPVIARELDRYAFLGLKAMAGAQFTYLSTTGNGFFGTHDDLINANLFTAPFGPRANWWGWHSWVVSTSASPSAFKVYSTPMFYRESGINSFYTDETGVLRGADRQGRRARENDPPIDISTSSDMVENERLAFQMLNGIRAAQQWYSNWGANDYGTFQQLQFSNLYRIPMEIDRFQGYVYTLTLVPRNGALPPHFEVIAVPEQYGVTGIKSFYADESFIIRGGDRNGAPATAQDPRIVFIQ
jgi:hypothetical protein